MNQTPLTLTYSGTEQTLAAWGYDQPRLTYDLGFDAPSRFTCRADGQDPATAEDIPYDGQIILRANRTWTGSAWTGGTIIFVGRREDYSGEGGPVAASTTRVFADAWWDLQRLIFQHTWRHNDGTSITTINFSRLFLFQDITSGPSGSWTYLTTQQQIQQVLTFAAACGVGIQTGTIDPTWNVPTLQVKAISCAEAIRICTRPMADVVKYFDYTTTAAGVPAPTLHIRQRANLSAQSLPYRGTDGSGRTHKTLSIKSRPDLQADCVQIQYQTNLTQDGETYQRISNDTYPSGGNPLSVGALIIPIDMRGSVTRNVKGTVDSLAIDPTTTDFWQKRKPDLAGNNISGLALVDTTINGGSGHAQGITITNVQTGVAVTLSSYPNELLAKGAIAPWMYAGSTQIVGVDVVISAWVTYTQKGVAIVANPVGKVSAHQVSYRCKLTNSAAGTVTYSAQQSYDSGDPAINGLAQAIYTSLATLQWEGQHTIFQAPITNFVDLSKTLNISGGATAWAGMAASLSRVDIDFTNSTQQVTFGPHRHLSAEQLLEYMLVWRWRIVQDNPSTRNTGSNDPSNDTTMPQDTAEKNTAEGHPEHSLHAIAAPPDGSGNQITLYHDPANSMGNGQFVLGKILSSGGALDTASPAVVVSLADLSGTDVAKLRSVGGGKVLCTAGFTGGNWTPGYIAALSDIYSDYIDITPIGGGTKFHVAKPDKLRCSITSETINGVTFSYSYTTTGSGAYVNRVATSSSVTENQTVVQPWLVNDVLWAVPVANSGVSAAPNWLDANNSGRAWAFSG